MYKNSQLNLDHLTTVQEVCIGTGVTLLVAWSYDEAGAYLSTLKHWASKQNTYTNTTSFLKKNPKASGPNEQTMQALTSVRRISETDAKNMLKSYKNIRSIVLLKDYNELLSFNGISSNKIEAIT